MKKFGMFILSIPLFAMVACDGNSGTRISKSLDDINDFYKNHSSEYVTIESFGNNLLPIGDDCYVRWVSEYDSTVGGQSFSICVMHAVSNPDQSSAAETIAVALEYCLWTEDAIIQSSKDSYAKITLDEKTFYNDAALNTSSEGNATGGSIYAYQYIAQTHQYKDTSMLNLSSYTVADNTFSASISGFVSDLERNAIRQSAIALFGKFVKFLKDNSFGNLFGTFYSLE